jgi:hypothetical protein
MTRIRLQKIYTHAVLWLRDLKKRRYRVLSYRKLAHQFELRPAEPHPNCHQENSGKSSVAPQYIRQLTIIKPSTTFTPHPHTQSSKLSNIFTHT